MHEQMTMERAQGMMFTLLQRVHDIMNKQANCALQRGINDQS